MSKLTVLDLFSGIGGFSLGFERTGGFETVAFCEIEPFCQKVLKKHWPKVPCYNDVRNLTQGNTPKADVITGGFPCQDVSLSGKLGGLWNGTRSGLFDEIIRIAGYVKPKFILLENVSNLLNGPSEQRGGWFGYVLASLASIGYDAEWHCIRASFIGAWHKRDRVWILAYPKREQHGEGRSEKPILQQRHLSGQFTRVFKKWPRRSSLPTPTLHRGTHGLSKELDSHGNAVVPLIPELIGHAILQSTEAAQ